MDYLLAMTLMRRDGFVASPIAAPQPAATEKAATKQQATVVLVLGLLMLLLQAVVAAGLTMLAVRLNWSCNQSVPYAIMTALFSTPYLVYRGLFAAAAAC